jgi:hypothetical protein
VLFFANGAIQTKPFTLMPSSGASDPASARMATSASVLDTAVVGPFNGTSATITVDLTTLNHQQQTDKITLSGGSPATDCQFPN